MASKLSIVSSGPYTRGPVVRIENKAVENKAVGGKRLDTSSIYDKYRMVCNASHVPHLARNATKATYRTPAPTFGDGGQAAASLGAPRWGRAWGRARAGRVRQSANAPLPVRQ
jgi:hypothetical protein